MTTIMPAFDRFPKEGEIIGRLLAGYGELELGLCLCVAAARSDFDMVFKAMFRHRGISQRLGIADAMGRTKFNDLQLGDRFSEAIADTQFCLQIRNQYTHCYWTDEFGRRLGFVELEETAKQNQRVENLFSILASYLDFQLLKDQEAYFLYVRDCLTFLEKEAERLVGKLTTHPWPDPKKVSRPPKKN